MKEYELSDLKKIIYDKVALFFTLILIGFVSLYLIDSKKKDIAYEQALALKYSDYQIETYKSANVVTYHFNIALYVFLNIQDDDDNFKDKMYQVEQEFKKLSISVEELKLLVVQNLPFLSPYSVQSIYLPLLEDLESFDGEMLKVKNDFTKAKNIAKQFIDKIEKYRSILLLTDKIFVKIESNNLDSIELYSN
ncbi:hypothetical protein [Sulfurimonas sp. C5]|uniref:hypothetical protein n=1 Tax=Sulfurimonas sp. C5 TaxID=3036947 RepID=UPI002453DBFC|nr:hypothetical protein [Sulfurimonas sp. C5]MDH4943822.1 hypothetical protein [Sulfurimonas sp. C5]